MNATYRLMYHIPSFIKELKELPLNKLFKDVTDNENGKGRRYIYKNLSALEDRPD